MQQRQKNRIIKWLIIENFRQFTIGDLSAQLHVGCQITGWQRLKHIIDTITGTHHFKNSDAPDGITEDVMRARIMREEIAPILKGLL